jgi:hypothetical protein
MIQFSVIIKDYAVRHDSGEAFFEGEEQIDDPTTVPMVFSVPIPGIYNIEIYAKNPEHVREGYTEMYLVANSSVDLALVRPTEFHYRRNLNRWNYVNRRHDDPVDITFSSTTTSVTVDVEYADCDSSVEYVNGAQVSILQIAGPSPTLVGEGTLSQQGSAIVPVNLINYTPLSLLVSVCLSNKYFLMGVGENPNSMREYCYYSSPYLITVNNPTLPYTINYDCKVFSIYNTMMLSATWAEEFLSFNAPPIKVMYPFGIISAFDGDPPIISLSPGTWLGVSTVGHEYGHWVMFVAFGNNMPPSEGGVFHDFCSDDLIISSSTAFVEGYADAFAVASLNFTGGYYYGEDRKINVEEYSCSIIPRSTYDEGRVAAAIWDLYDEDNDDNGGNPDRGLSPYSDNNMYDRPSAYCVFIESLQGRPSNMASYENYMYRHGCVTNSQLNYALAIWSYNYVGYVEGDE